MTKQFWKARGLLNTSTLGIALGATIVVAAQMAAISSAQAKPSGFLARYVIAPIAGTKAAERADAAHRKMGKPLDELPKKAIKAIIKSL